MEEARASSKISFILLDYRGLSRVLVDMFG